MSRNLNDILMEGFQQTVEQYVKRNKNLLDSLSKFQTAGARFCRASIKSATQCGCIKIEGSTQDSDDASSPKTKVTGELCETCKDTIQKELGDVLFYLVAVCNALDINVYDVILNEQKMLDTLGPFSLK